MSWGRLEAFGILVGALLALCRGLSGPIATGSEPGPGRAALLVVVWLVVVQLPGAGLARLLGSDAAAAGRGRLMMLSPWAFCLGHAWWIGILALSTTLRVASIQAVLVVAAAGAAVLAWRVWSTGCDAPMPPPPEPGTMSRALVAVAIVSLAVPSLLVQRGYFEGHDFWRIAAAVQGRVDWVRDLRWRDVLESGWEQLLAVLVALTGGDAFWLQRSLLPLAGLLAAVALVDLGRALGLRLAMIAWALLAMLLFVLTDLRTEGIGYGVRHVSRITEDKTLAVLVVLPTLLAAWVRALRRRRSGGAGLVIATISGFLLNPMVVVWLALSLGPLAGRALWGNARSRATVLMMLGVASIGMAAAALEAWQIRSHRADARQQEPLAGRPFDPKLARAVQVDGNRRLLAAAAVAGLLLAIGPRDRAWWLLALGSALVLAASQVEPAPTWTRAVIGSEVHFRVPWAIQLPLIVAAGLRSIRWRLRRSSLPVLRELARGVPAVAMLALVVASLPRIPPAWRSLQMRHDVSVSREAREVAAALRQLGSPVGTAVLVPNDLVLPLRGMVGRVRAVPSAEDLWAARERAGLTRLLDQEGFTSTWLAAIDATQADLLVVAKQSALGEQLVGLQGVVETVAETPTTYLVARTGGARPPRVRLVEAEDLMAAGKPVSALRLLQAGSHDPSEVATRIRALRGSGDLQASLTAATLAVAEWPELLGLRLEWMASAAAVGDAEGALVVWRHALELANSRIALTRACARWPALPARVRSSADGRAALEDLRGRVDRFVGLSSRRALDALAMLDLLREPAFALEQARRYADRFPARWQLSAVAAHHAQRVEGRGAAVEELARAVAAYTVPHPVAIDLSLARLLILERRPTEALVFIDRAERSSTRREEPELAELRRRAEQAIAGR